MAIAHNLKNFLKNQSDKNRPQVDPKLAHFHLQVDPLDMDLNINLKGSFFSGPSISEGADNSLAVFMKTTNQQNNFVDLQCLFWFLMGLIILVSRSCPSVNAETRYWHPILVLHCLPFIFQTSLINHRPNVYKRQS